jgi:membrane protein
MQAFLRDRVRPPCPVRESIMRTLILLLRETVSSFVAHGASRLAAALSYYAIFSLAPLSIIVLGISGAVLGDVQAREQLLGGVLEQVGPEVANLVENLIDSTIASPLRGTATIIGSAILLFAATGFFTQLQVALNVVWSVRETRWSGVRQYLFMRVLSLGMVLLLSLLLLITVALQAGLALLNRQLSELLPENLFIVAAGNQLLTLLLFVLVFGTLFRLLTHARVDWREVLVGSLVTAVLFRTGLILIALYLRIAGISSAFGAAGSLVVLLLWIYYSMQIMLFGAEFTRAYGAWLQQKQAGREREG